MHRNLLIVIIIVGYSFGWNPSPIATQQHTELNSIIFQDAELQALADSLNLDWVTICDQFNEPSKSGQGTGFSSFDTWESFKYNWSSKPDITQALQDLLHYVEDSSVPVNHSPAGNKFQGYNKSSDSYSSAADDAENRMEYVNVKDYVALNIIYGGFIAVSKPWYIKKHTDGMYNEDVYGAKQLRHSTHNYIAFYNSLLSKHKQTVESKAVSFRKYAEKRGVAMDPRDYMVRGYSEAVSLGREVVYIYLYCKLHPEVWNNPSPRSDIMPIVNLLLD